jgi:hypothetical protein
MAIHSLARPYNFSSYGTPESLRISSNARSGASEQAPKLQSSPKANSKLGFAQVLGFATLGVATLWGGSLAFRVHQSIPPTLTKSVIKEMEKLPKNEFLIEAQKHIATHMKIPHDTLPPVFLGGLPNEKMLMAFDWSQNAIFVNPTALNQQPPSQVYALLRHEMEHFRQNTDIIRTEGLGDEAIQFYASRFAKAQFAAFLKQYEHLTLEKIKILEKEGTLSEISLNAIKDLHTAKQKGSTEVALVKSRIEKGDTEVYLSAWKTIQEKAMQTFGSIPKNSVEGKKAQAYYKGFLANDGKVSGVAYWTSRHELEASDAQGLGYLGYLWKKHVF